MPALNGRQPLPAAQIVGLRLLRRLQLRQQLPQK
jgi:hypothetical protein